MYNRMNGMFVFDLSAAARMLFGWRLRVHQDATFSDWFSAFRVPHGAVLLNDVAFPLSIIQSLLVVSLSRHSVHRQYGCAILFASADYICQQLRMVSDPC